MSTQAPKNYVDVLIIGAGPAGLMCGNALATAGGINVRIIDQRPSKVAVGQADGIQPRTIEVLQVGPPPVHFVHVSERLFQSYGLANHLLNEGNQMHMCAFYNPNGNSGIELTGRAPDVTAPTARFPFEITLHQGAIERIFIDSMNLHNLTVDRPVKPSAIELSQDYDELSSPTAYPVKVTLEHLNATNDSEKTEVVYAKYVVGADGAHSWVRKAFGISMDGEQTGEFVAYLFVIQ
ncbi:hypothetical protein ID866_11188 [Astraeus odoratus]|nr:hypothetical protein ID866_11188 [Astraeus odoratus]